VLSLLILIAREPLFSTGAAARAPWIAWTGGVFGAIFIATNVLMIPRFGVATVTTLIVVGQLLGSLVFDHFGLLGTPQQSINLARIVGAGFLIAGAALIRL
jgi:transporter family-2 protein